MIVSITHCTVCWGYRQRAQELAAELRRRFGADVTIVAGHLGQFDVRVDGELVVSRGETWRTRLRPVRPPEAAEVIAVIERHRGHEAGAPTGPESRN